MSRLIPRRGSGEAVASRPAVLPLAGDRSLVVSARAVREGVAAWAAGQRSGRRPDAAAWRDGVAVASAIAESAAQLLRSGDARTAPWEVTVPVASEPADLMRRSLLPANRVRELLDVLVSAQVLDLVERVGDDWSVRLRSASMETAPVLGAVVWDGVRSRLQGVGGGPSALAVVRELARRTSPGARAAGHFERMTVAELCEVTGYGKSALRSGMEACTAARLVDARTRDRVASYYRLLPGVFSEGAADDQGAPAPFQHPAPRRSVRGAARTERPHRAADRTPDGATPAASTSPSGVSSSPPSRVIEDGRLSDSPTVRTSGQVDPAAVIEIGGVPFPVPPGVQPVLEQDAEGRFWYRVGTVRLGPLVFG